MSRVNISIKQEERLSQAGVWPKDGAGREYCQVYFGKHRGVPTWTNEQIEQMIEGTFEY